MTEEVKKYIERHKFLINNFKPTEILQIATTISTIEEYSENDLKKIIKVLSNDTNNTRKENK